MVTPYHHPTHTRSIGSPTKILKSTAPTFGHSPWTRTFVAVVRSGVAVFCFVWKKKDCCRNQPTTVDPQKKVVCVGTEHCHRNKEPRTVLEDFFEGDHAASPYHPPTIRGSSFCSRNLLHRHTGPSSHFPLFEREERPSGWDPIRLSWLLLLTTFECAVSIRNHTGDWSGSEFPRARQIPFLLSFTASTNPRPNKNSRLAIGIQ